MNGSKKVWHVYKMEQYSRHKKDWNLATCDNTNGPREYYAKLSKGKQVRKGKANTVIPLLCGL